MSSHTATLHVIDAHTAPWACLHALAELARVQTHYVLLIGNTADIRRARRAGVSRFFRHQARSNDPRHARRALSDLTAQHGPFDRIVAWDDRTESAVTLITDKMSCEKPPAEARGAFPSAPIDRRDTRARWNLDDTTFVLSSAHDHPREVDAMRLVYHAALLSVAERPTVAVLPSDAHQLERAARFAWRHDRARWFVIDDRSPLLLRDAVDASCWQVQRKSVGTQTLEMLAGSGQPVVAERCSKTASLAGENVRLTEPVSELGATKALFGELVRVEAVPDPEALTRALEGSLAGV